MAVDLLAEQNPAPRDLLAVPSGGPSDLLAEPQPTPGFFERLGARMIGRGEQFNEIVAATRIDAEGERDQSLPESIMQILGKVVAGGVLDVAGEGISTVAGGAFDLLNKITPDPVKDAVMTVWEDAVGSEVVQAASDAAQGGIEAYGQWAENNPRFARNIEAIANIGILVAPVKGARPGVTTGAARPTVVGRAAQAVEGAAESQVAAQRANFVQGLLRPKATQRVLEAEAPRTTGGGILRGFKVTPTASEAAIAKTVSDVVDVKLGNTLVQNQTAIQTALSREAESLASLLSTNTTKIPRATIKSSMDDVLARLGERNLLVGDPEKTGERFLREARKLLAANPNTPVGVLRARQQFDKWVTDQKPKFFEAIAENAQTSAGNEIRREMNDIVIRNAPGVGVRESLTTQSNLFEAIKNITPKIADEKRALATTAFGRLRDSVNRAVPGLSKPITLADLGIAGALGTGAAIAPPVAAGALLVGGIGFGAGKLIFSVTTKRAVAALLRQSERAIQQAKRQGASGLVSQLRAERVAVIEIMRNSVSDE